MAALHDARSVSVVRRISLHDDSSVVSTCMMTSTAPNKVSRSDNIESHVLGIKTKFKVDEASIRYFIFLAPTVRITPKLNVVGLGGMYYESRKRHFQER